MEMLSGHTHNNTKALSALGGSKEGAITCVTEGGGMGEGVMEGFSEEVVFGQSPAHHCTFSIKAGIALRRIRLWILDLLLTVGGVGSGYKQII